MVSVVVASDRSEIRAVVDAVFHEPPLKPDPSAVVDAGQPLTLARPLESSAPSP